MSKQNNVNPNYYKVGGREPSEGHGEGILHERQKQELKYVTEQMKHENEPEKVLPGQKQRLAKRK